MESSKRKAYIEEVNYQYYQLGKLKKSLRMTFIFTSIGLSLYFFAKNYVFISVLGLILFVVTILLSLTLGLAIRNGSRNIEKILKIIENNKVNS